MTPRLGIASVLTVLLAGTLTALGAGTASAADPLAGAPAVGQCSDMSRKELGQASYTEAPVDCAGPHTAEVVAVATMPDGVGYGVGIGKLTRIAIKACRPAVQQRVGASGLGLRLTAYEVVFFVPTKAQRAAGARWLRCDVALRGGKRLLTLPGDLAVGEFPFPTAVSRCLVGRQLLATACSQRHSYRSTAAMKVRGKRYPERAAWLRIGRRACPSAVRTPRDYRFTWSSRAAWQTGDKTLVCYSRSRR